MKQIKYRSLKKYKYQLVEDYRVKTPITGYRCFTSFISLFKNGVLVIKKGYSWNGASGGSFDTITNMRPSLIHDVFYQLLRMGVLKQTDRFFVDMLYKATCMEDGMNKLRADFDLWMLKKLGTSSAKVKPPPKIYTAP